MSKIISTYGTVENFTKSALLGLGATEQDANGRYYLDGNMVNVELSSTIAEAIYIGEIFRDGQAVTGKYTTDTEAGAVRVMLDTPYDHTSRTLSYGGRPGTAGNSGAININPPLLPTNDEFMIYLNQVNDQMLLFPKISKEYIPLDIMSRKIASYADSVVMDRSASTLAEILAYNIFRSLNAGDNLNTIPDLNADNAYGNLFNALNAKLDNGDRASGAFTYSTEGRTIIGRPTFVNKIFNKDSGIILLGGDLAQSMLRAYDLETNISDRGYVGTNYKGAAGQFHIQNCPDYIWTLAEGYLGLPEGALDNIYAVAVSFEATAMGRVIDLGAKTIDANEVRGSKVQPLNIWGHEAFRKTQIIGDGTLTNDYLTTTLGFDANTRKWPVSPSVANNRDKAAAPIYDENGAIVGYKVIAEGIKPNGGNWKSGIPQVNAVSSSVESGTYSEAQSVTLTTTTAGATIYYTTDGSDPTSASTKYTDAVSVSASTTLKAFAVKAGEIPAPITSYKYVIGV